MAPAVASRLQSFRFERNIDDMIRDPAAVAKNSQSAWTGFKMGGFSWAFF
jgi:hypothetical protein